MKSVSALSHAFVSRSLIIHITELARRDANCCLIYSHSYAPTVQLSQKQTKRKKKERIIKEAWIIDSGISSLDIIIVVCDVFFAPRSK